MTVTAKGNLSVCDDFDVKFTLVDAILCVSVSIIEIPWGLRKRSDEKGEDY